MKPKMSMIAAFLAVALLSPWAVGQVFYPAPQGTFNPLAATDAELAAAGFPPRPDQSQPELYEHWVKMVTTPQVRLTNPKVTTTNVVNSVIQDRNDQGTVGNIVSTSSSNWSGFAITAPNGTFTKNNNYVFTEFTMPAIGRDNCAYGPYAMSEWVGFDGFGSGDVLQAGVASTACSTSYLVWYEWFESGCTSSSPSFPCYQTNLSLPVAAGDYLSVEVWYTTTAPRGHAYILNYNTRTSVSVAFNQPSGSAVYEGNSAEWVVERPGLVTGSGITLENLANYLGAPSNLDYAYNGTYYRPGSTPGGTTAYNITMTCPPWNPSSACPTTKGLSWVELNGTQTLWVFDEGPAFQ